MSKQFQTCLHPLWTGLVHQFGKLKGCHMMSPTHHFRLIGSTVFGSPTACYPRYCRTSWGHCLGTPRTLRCFAASPPGRAADGLRAEPDENLLGALEAAKHSEISADRRDGGGSKMIKGKIKICSKHVQSTCAIIIQASSISRIKQHWNCTMLHSNA